MPRSICLNIPEPCHENWHNMTPREQGRFCGSCQKVVVDFSVMTDKEVLDYFSKASQQVCGRFANDQLNKEIGATAPKKRVTWLYVWNLILASLLITKTYAQGQPQVKKQPVKTTINEMPRLVGWANTVPVQTNAVIPVSMKGVVLDAQTNQPVEGASIIIKGVIGGASADASGHFRLHVKKRKLLELEVSAISYETQTVIMDRMSNLKNIRVLLKPAYNTLEQVTVTSSPIVCRRTLTTGPVRLTESPVKVDTFFSSFINKCLPVALKKDCKVYPNPVIRGNNIQVKLNLPQTGEYKLELLNTAGQVMLIQPLFLQTKEQQIDLYTQTKWSAGIYWLRISSSKMKNVFEARVLLQ